MDAQEKKCKISKQEEFISEQVDALTTGYPKPCTLEALMRLSMISFSRTEIDILISTPINQCPAKPSTDS